MTRRPRLITVLTLLTALALGGCSPEPTPPLHWRLLVTQAGDGPLAKHLAERIDTLSGGRLRLEVLSLSVADRLVRVASGEVELALGDAGQDPLPATAFFGNLAFGLSGAQLNAWLRHGGGQQFWDQAYAPLGVKAVALGQAGRPLAGWFNREIDTLIDLKGLKIRMPGLDGEVLGRLGATRVALSDKALPGALGSGALDASDSLGLQRDLALGLHRATRYAYYPGWHIPQLSLLINPKAYAALPSDLQALLIETAHEAARANLDEELYQDSLALERLTLQGAEFRPLPEDVLNALREQSEALLGERAAQTELNGRLWASMKSFQALSRPLQRLSEQAP